MRIFIENHGPGPDIRLHLPTGLFLNRLTAAAGARFLSQHGVQLTAAQLHRLFVLLHRTQKNFPRLPLVELEGAAGIRVRIIL